MIGLGQRLKAKSEGYNKLFDSYDFDLRVASPGIIQSFDSEKQTVTVQLAITERIVCNDPTFIEKHGKNRGEENVPLLVDVPICIPRAGEFALTVPIKVGDECLVVFSDTCFDAWYQSGGIQNQMSLRRHDLSDGFAIIGICSQPNVLSNYSTDAIQLRSYDGTKFIEVSLSNIKVVSDSSSLTVSGSDIKLDSDEVHTTGNLHSGTGATGTFMSYDQKVITVVDGIITDIS